MPIVSYAQNFEDIMLYRALKHVQPGFFVDVGAHHFEIDSVSLLFSKLGWTGIHVEPIAKLAEALKVNRPQDTVLQAAVGTEPGVMTLYEVADAYGITTGDKGLAQRHADSGFEIRETSVEKRTLADILDNVAPEGIHWLKIDVEGMEHDVIKSWTGSSKRPWIVLLESTEPMSPKPNHHGWEPDLVALGYKFVFFDGLNRFYISQDHPELEQFFTCGPNFFDYFVVTSRHWLARLIVAEQVAKDSKAEKGPAVYWKRFRQITRPLRHRVKALFGFKKKRSPEEFAPVPGMSLSHFRAISKDVFDRSNVDTESPNK